MGPYCSKFDVTFFLSTLRGQRIGHHWDKTSGRVIFSSKATFMAKLCYKAPSRLHWGTSIPHKISFFIQQGSISYQNDISQKALRLRDLVVRPWEKFKNCATHSRIMRSRICRSVCAHKKAIGLSSIQAREEYTQMLMLVLSAPWSFN